MSLPTEVVDHGYALPAGDGAHLLGKITLGIDNRMIATMPAGNLGLLPAADGANHGRAKMLGPLADDQADAAGGGMDQDEVAGLHRIRFVQQITGGHAADHHRGRRAFIDAVRQHDHARGRHQPHFRIGSIRTRDATHAIANTEAQHVRADRVDHTRAFKADAGGKGAHAVDAAAHQHVAIIHGDRLVTQAHLAAAGVGDDHVLELQYVGSAMPIEAERLGHRRLSVTVGDELCGRA